MDLVRFTRGLNTSAFCQNSNLWQYHGEHRHLHITQNHYIIHYVYDEDEIKARVENHQYAG